MDQENGRHRVRAPLGDADRLIVCNATRQCVRDEVLDVVVERVALALGYGVPIARAPSLRLRGEGPAPAPAPDDPPAPLGAAIVEPRVDPWTGLHEGPVVRIMPREGAVLARIG